MRFLILSIPKKRHQPRRWVSAPMLIVELVAVLYSTLLLAQSPAPPPRIALVITNFKYPASTLPGAEHDANTIRNALQKLGFVGINGPIPTVLANATTQQIMERLIAFKEVLQKKENRLAIGFIYYAGHGGADREGNDNYLLPVDISNIETVDFKKQGISVRRITEMLRQVDERPLIALVIDACRTSSASRQMPHGTTLYMVKPDEMKQRGMLLALSTSENASAPDSSIYADTLAEKLNTSGMTIDGVFEEVRKDVARKTNYAQVPDHRSKVVENVCLISCPDRSRIDQQLSTEASLSILERIRSQLPSSDIGQVAALKTLSESGRRLAGLDLRGFYLEHAHFTGLDLSGSDMSGTALSQASFEKSVFTKVILDFAVGREMRMVGAKLDQSSHQYADYDRADLSDTSLRQANLYFATLRGATLTNADFTGANLAYADLSGAIVTNAIFHNAILYGANLKGAKGLETARFQNTSITNMVGASVRSFTEQEVCGHYISAGGGDYMRVVQMTPSSHFESGFKYEILGHEGAWNYMPAATLGMAHYHFLRPCPEPPPGDKAVGVKYTYGKDGSHSELSIATGRKFHRDLLAKRGLYGYIESRLETRNDEVIAALSTHDFVVPDSTRDKDIVAHLQRVAASIREPHVDCIDKETIGHLLRAKSVAGAERASFIYDEIRSQISDDAAKLYAIEQFEKESGHLAERSILLPFGTVLPNPVPAREVREYANLSLGRRTIDAYKKWSAKRSANTRYAFCFQSRESPAGSADYGPSSFMSDATKLGNALVEKAVAVLPARPHFFTNHGFLSKRYFVLGLYFAGVPPAILVNPKAPIDGFGSKLDKYSQHQVLLDIDRVQARPDVPLVLVHTRYLREQTISIGAASRK